MTKTSTLKQTGPISMGRQPSTGGYVVRDARTNSAAWFTTKDAALRAFNNRVANLRHEAPAATTQRAVDAARCYALGVARQWVARSEWEDRRV